MDSNALITKKKELKFIKGFLGEILTEKKFSQFCGNLTGFLDPASRFQNLNLATLALRLL